MADICLLNRGWQDQLGDLVRRSDQELVIVSPYISRGGAAFVTENLPARMKTSGHLVLLTDLSPTPICQGSTDPSAIRLLVDNVQTMEIYHLPKLHAKVYVSDSKKAIITSGNLTNGGLYNNYEYGVSIDEPVTVAGIRNDVLDYAGLGALVHGERLIEYCKIAERLRESFRDQLARIANTARNEFREVFLAAEEELLKLRLARGAMHTVFENAILYFLRTHGPIDTPRIHSLIESVYPDLCDNSVDRVVNGERFGKRWKHAVRTAQQHLKEKGLVKYLNGKWSLSPERL
jgi:hypothetical protein